MKKLVLLLVLASFAVAAQWSGDFAVTDSGVTATVTVTGESPLAINIPASAVITGANYSNGTAIFDGSFNYTYSSTDLVLDSVSDKVFLFVFSQPQEFDYIAKVRLPQFTVINSSSPSANYSTDGKTITAVWSGQASEAQLILRFSPQQKPQMFLLRTGIPVLDRNLLLPGIILSFLFGYFFGAGLMGVLFQRIKRITAGMNSDEKTIVHLLKNGEMEQSKLQQETNFSKAKLSRTLRSMEERGIIKKVPHGKKNLISLK